jgi:SP family general alpha glucoside:H+ symporter-like MFS transporter
MASNDGPKAFAPPESIVTMAQEKDSHVPDRNARPRATDQVIAAAKRSTEKEKSMTLLQGVRLYPKAIAWSMLISTCIVMEGYDVCLINNFCGSPPPPAMPPRCAMALTTTCPLDAFPQFNRKYGEQLPGGKWEVPAPWQAGLSNVSHGPSSTALRSPM